MIWREKRALLIALAILLTANTIFFFTYRVRYEERLRDLELRQEASEARLKQARNERLSSERQSASYRQIQRDVQDIYTQQWATQGERLAPLISEVKRLAVASQLVPTTYAFTRSDSKDSKAEQTGTFGATIVGISFTVQGTYEQVRKLINLLELSRQFVIVDQISLSSVDKSALTINLHVKTLFRDTTPQPRGVNQPL